MKITINHRFATRNEDRWQPFSRCDTRKPRGGIGVCMYM